MIRNYQNILKLISITIVLIATIISCLILSKSKNSQFECGVTNEAIDFCGTPSLFDIPDSLQLGRHLFEENCTMCHMMGKKLVGPDLSKVLNRRENEWVNQFTLNSKDMIKNGDPIAIKVYNEYFKTEMPSHKFNQKELKALIKYYEFENERYKINTFNLFEKIFSFSSTRTYV